MKHAPLATTALVAALLVGLAACSRPTAAEQGASLDEAQAMLDRADYGSAQSICDEVRQLQLAAAPAATARGRADAAALLGRLSILYMKLADAASSESDIEHAYQCFLEAYAADSLAAAGYYNALGVEEMPLGVLLAGIVHNATAPADDVGAIDADTTATPAPQAP